MLTRLLDQVTAAHVKTSNARLAAQAHRGAAKVKDRRWSAALVVDSPIAAVRAAIVAEARERGIG